MADSEAEAQYKHDFTTRVKGAREALGWKQWQMAQALGIPQDQYKQYEGRSMMPHRFIWPFCMFARVNPEWLLTGQGKRAPKPVPIVEPDIVPSSRKTARKGSKRSAA